MVCHIESILIKCQESTKCTHWIRKHKVCCIFTASNIPGFTDAKSFSGKNPSASIEEGVEYFQLMRTEVTRLARNKWREVLEELDMKINVSEHDKEKNRLQRIKGEFEDYCDTLTMLSYNGSAYDSNVAREFLFRALKIGQTSIPVEELEEECEDECEEEISQDVVDTGVPKENRVTVIKRGNNYKTILAGG